MRAEQGAGPVFMKKAKNTWYGGVTGLCTHKHTPLPVLVVGWDA